MTKHDDATLTQKLKDLDACEGAIKWSRGLSPAKAWRTCKRGDWMLWIAAYAVDRKMLVLAACDCAELSLKFVPDSELRPAEAIAMARAWCHGEATLRQVQDASYAARAAAAYAAYAAADAANTNAADAANAAADAANAAADADTADAARGKSLAKCATLVRKRIGWRDVWEGLDNDETR